MNAMTGCRKFGAALGLALFGITANAVDPESVSWDWSANPTQGTTVTNALDWFAPANWVGGEPVNSNVLKADFTTGAPAETRYVKIDRDVRVADVTAASGSAMTTNSTQKVVVVSDHEFLFDRPADISIPVPNGLMLYADVSWKATTYPKSVIFCGDLFAASGSQRYLAFAFGNPLEIRYDLYAKSSDPVRKNLQSFTGMTLNAGHLTIAAPHGSSEAVVGTWSQTKGSPYIVRTGAAHVLCAGTVVLGTGIGEGTFVKRIFPDGIVELSAAATETIADNELTFAAFSPKVSQSFYIFSNQANTPHALNFMKWREEDEFRVTLEYVRTTGAGASYEFNVKEGVVPATTVIKTAAGMNGLGKFVFGNCRLEFGVVGEGEDLNFAIEDNRVSEAKAVAHLVVSNGLAATLGNFSKMTGMLVKEGAGALTLGLTGAAADYPGAMVAQEGTLSFAVSGEGFVETLAISNGATLHIPEGGLRCETLIVQPGAAVAGPGTLTVLTCSDDILNVVRKDGAQVVYADTVRRGEIFIEPPATNVPGDPAVWFDASRLDTLTYDDVNGVNCVSAWNDVRGAAYMSSAATCETKKPQLFVGSDGKCNFVYFQQDNNTGAIAESYELSWNRKVEGIRSVFKVVGCRQGGGQFLGNSSLWRNAEYRTYSNPVMYDGLAKDGAAAPLSTTRFYVNGEKKAWTNGYAYVGSVTALLPEARTPQVAELHLDGNTAYAQGFSAQENAAKGRNGNQDLYELIVYTNVLTEAERLAVTGYLMKKWLNAEANFETFSQVEVLSTLSAGQDLGVADGTKVAAKTLSGAGTVTKSGAGQLYVADCVSDETALKVDGGTVILRSVMNTRETVPSGALLHIDAADETTYLATHGSGANTYLTKWGDVRGDGYETVSAKNPTTTSTTHPKIEAEKCNGLPMIDFGSFGTAVDNTMTSRVMTVRSFFTVQNSEKGGGYLFGDTKNNCATYGARGAYGLIRYPTGLLTDPIIRASFYGSTVQYFGPGATKVRLNGEDVLGTSACFTGGNDLLTIQVYEGLSGDSISHGNCNNPIYGGGKMIGELLYYENRLSNEETKRIEAYLNKKWFNRETPGYRPAQLAAVDVAEGATLTLVGGAPIQVTSCSGAGTVEGGIRFTADADWTVTVGADGVSSALTVTGTFDVSSVGRLVLRGTGKAEVGSYVLATTGGIVGDVGAIPIDATDASDRRRYALRQNGNDIVLDVQPLGLTVIVR